MRFSRLFLAAALTLGAMTLGPALMPAATAVAQEVATTKVSAAPLVESALAGVTLFIGSVLTVGIAFLCNRFYALTGLTIEARWREALHSALMTGVNEALRKVADLIGGQAIDVHATIIAETLDYVRQSVPDALAGLKPNDALLRSMAGSTLERVLASRSVPLTALTVGEAADTFRPLSGAAQG